MDELPFDSSLLPSLRDIMPDPPTPRQDGKHAPRPMNYYFLFRTWCAHKVSAEKGKEEAEEGEDNKSLPKGSQLASTVFAKAWNNAPKAVKDHFKGLQLEAKNEHDRICDGCHYQKKNNNKEEGKHRDTKGKQKKGESNELCGINEHSQLNPCNTLKSDDKSEDADLNPFNIPENQSGTMLASTHIPLPKRHSGRISKPYSRNKESKGKAPEKRVERRFNARQAGNESFLSNFVASPTKFSAQLPYVSDGRFTLANNNAPLYPGSPLEQNQGFMPFAESVYDAANLPNYYGGSYYASNPGSPNPFETGNIFPPLPHPITQSEDGIGGHPSASQQFSLAPPFPIHSEAYGQQNASPFHPSMYHDEANGEISQRVELAPHLNPGYHTYGQNVQVSAPQWPPAVAYLEQQPLNQQVPWGAGSYGDIAYPNETSLYANNGTVNASASYIHNPEETMSNFASNQYTTPYHWNYRN